MTLETKLEYAAKDLCQQGIYTLPQRLAHKAGLGKLLIEGDKEFLVDTLGNVTYSWLVGAILDYKAGLNFTGIVASRTSATGINSATGGLYGKWRNVVFEKTKTNKESGKTKNILVDLFAFNSFQVPVYATAIAIGSYVSEGEVNLEKVKDGAEYLAIVSPAIGPTMGLWMDSTRKIFKLKSASEKAK